MSYASELADTAADSKKQLLSNLRRVISDAESFLEDVTDDRRVNRLKDRALDNLETARDRFADADKMLRRRAREAASVTDEYVHDNPWAAIGAAAALGVVLGLLMHRD